VSSVGDLPRGAGGVHWDDVVAAVRALGFSEADGDLATLRERVAEIEGTPPPAHTHAESDVTDLATDLAAKAAGEHAHAQADVTDLASDLADLQSQIEGIGSLAFAYAGTDAAGDSWLTMTAQVVYVKRFTLAVPALVTCIEAYLRDDGNGGLYEIDGLIWQDAAPRSLLMAALGVKSGIGPSFNVNQTGRWFSTAMAPVYLPAGDYIAGVVANAGGATSHVQLAYAAGTPDKKSTLGVVDYGAESDSAGVHSIRVGMLGEATVP
jgi:hypothetical protein